MPNAAPVTYPLGAPLIAGTALTVDLALKQPGRITKRLADLTLQKFIVDKLFQSSGTTTQAGAIIYDQITSNQLYLARDVEQRAPGQEYPVVSGVRPAPKVATAEDWGGKFPVTDEAVSRNDRVYFDIQTTQLANTIVKKVNERTVAVLDAVIAGLGGAGVITGHNWSNVTLTGNTPTPNNQRPAADFAAAQLAADREELGVSYDLWIMNPQEGANLAIAYGEMLAQVLNSANISIFTSNRVAAGTAYAAASGQVGFLDYEKQLQTETWREAEERTSWVQSFVMPIMGVTNPYAVKKFTGLAG